MPYPLTPGTGSGGDSRQRLIPPLGCPGESELVWPVDAAEWLALGYRHVALQPAPLELSWLPEACTRGGFVIWLLLRCRSSPPTAVTPTIDHRSNRPEPDFVICGWCTNNAKHDMTPQELLAFCTAVLNHSSN